MRLVVLLLIAAVWGSRPALLALLVPELCCASTFSSCTPIYTLTIADGALGRRPGWRARHRSLLEASLDALVTIGSDGRINDVNAAIEELRGARPT